MYRTCLEIDNRKQNRDPEQVIIDKSITMCEWMSMYELTTFKNENICSGMTHATIAEYNRTEAEIAVQADPST